MRSIIKEDVEVDTEREHPLIEWGEFVLGLGACVLMGYFFYSKGYWGLLTHIWSSFFG